MRRTRHRRRFHTDRVVANRRRFLLDHDQGWMWEVPARVGWGKLADRHPLDCGRRCLMCHPRHIEPKARDNRQREAIDYDLRANGALY
jgi:hypothetical protein